MTADGALPPACTLVAADGPARVARWKVLDAAYRLGSVRAAGELVVRYREGARAALTALVDAERRCCGFVDWSVQEAAGEVHLRVRGRDHDLDALLGTVAG
jgi:hypothetical protein